MRCVDCGRFLLRAAAELPTKDGVRPGALGPTCARRRGLLRPKKAPLFAATKRRTRKASASTQIALELA